MLAIDCSSYICIADITSLMVSMGGGGSLFLHRFTITHVTFLKKLICRVQQQQELSMPLFLENTEMPRMPAI